MGKTTPLLVPLHSGLRVSMRDFNKLCQANPDLRLERTARGELVVMPPAGTESGGRNANLTAQLWFWAQADGTGVVFDSSTGFTLPNGALRSPDASWLAKDRWNELSAQEKKKFAHVCPDFLVELRSPSDPLRDIRLKMEEYVGQGARLGWLIDPESRTVEIYRPDRPVERLKSPATLSGEDVLPGFVLDLKGILYG